MNLKEIVQDSDTVPGRVFDVSVLILIAVSIISFPAYP